MSRKEPQVLEAVTAMARIATLAFHPEGSKIAIRNHNVVICPPSSGDVVFNLIPKSLVQGIDRYWNSDSRNDLHILNHVIKNFIDLYVIPYQKDKQTYQNLINLAKYTCVGLMKLQRTYSDEHCNAVLVIQLYINILRDLIRGHHDQSSFYIPRGEPSKPIVHEETGDLTLSTIFDIEKFKTFWSKKELDRLCQQFNGCFKNKGEVDDVIFSPNEMNDDRVFNLLIKTEGEIDSGISGVRETDDCSNDSMSGSLLDLPPTTGGSQPPLIPTNTKALSGSNAKASSGSGEREFTLPEPSNQSLPIVAGYIVSIMKILDAMDQRFTAVLTQSMQGISK